jgi:phosphinothricin acetyltransferase
MTLIRDAAPGDAEAVAALYAVHVETGVGTFEETAPDAAEMSRRMAAVAALSLPFLLAEDSEGILGFTYASPFRLRSAYRYAAEDSIYVAPRAQGRGVGRALLARLIDECAALGLRQLAAVIGDKENAASIGLHSALGFRHVGLLEAVGYKHGRWLDVVFMQISLNGGAKTPPEGMGLRL